VFTLFPNPTSGHLQVSSQAQIEEISILTIAGIELFKTTQVSFDLGHLPTGVYLIKIITRQGTATSKFVKL